MEKHGTKVNDLIEKEEKVLRLRKLALEYIKSNSKSSVSRVVFQDKIGIRLEAEGENANSVRVAWDIAISAALDKMSGHDKLQKELNEIDTVFVDHLLDVAAADGVDEAIDLMIEKEDIDEFTLAYARAKLGRIRIRENKG